MKDGKYEPQTAFLRMRQDIDNPNPQMWVSCAEFLMTTSGLTV